MLVIIVGLTASSVSTTLNSPKNLKSWLKEGQAYENVPSAVGTLIEAQGDAGEMPLGEDTLDTAITEVLEPSWLEGNVENILDASYLFLEGETQIPDFEIDIADRKDVIVTAISQSFKSRIRNLPQCTPAQEAAIQPSTFDPMEAGCRPSFFSDQALNQMEAQMEIELEKELTQNELLQEGTVSSKDLINISEKEVETIQSGYKHFARVPLYFVILLLTISLIIFLLVPKLRNKLLTLGSIWVIPSLVALVMVPVARTLVPNLYQRGLEASDFENPRILIEVVDKPLKLALNTITARLLIFSGVLLLLGIALLVGGFISKTSEKNIAS